MVYIIHYVLYEIGVKRQVSSEVYMAEESLKSGKCPKCGASRVFTNKDAPARGDRAIIPVSSMRSLYVHTYLCLECGYFEEFVDQNQLHDSKNIDKILNTWKKV